MSSSKICFVSLPEELRAGTAEVLSMLHLAESPNGTRVLVKAGDCLSLIPDDGGVTLTYATRPEYFRGLSLLPAALDGKYTGEQHNDGMLCLMADNSRNSVGTMESNKRMLRYLALMGYNALMLYTEDTYELEGYPYFGHLRGRYTVEELRELDAYAALFGIEIVPCIQALAHLNCALQWPDFDPVHDVTDILLVGEEKTYALIEEMLITCKAAFRSRRINLGMDEAHMLGRGKYLARNGYRPPEEIMLEHLARVTELCQKHGFEPMIWSDMFFSMAFGRYRVREGEVPPEVAKKVPAGLTLIYWDYYSLDRGIFSHMLDCHKKFPNNETAFAGGAWCWSGFAPCNRFSLVSTEMQLAVCDEYGMKNVIVTAWGDDGHEASRFAPLPVLLYFAEHAFGAGTDEAQLETRAKACFDIGFEELLLLDAPNELPGRNPRKICNPCKYLLYNDPLSGMFDLHLEKETVSAGFRAAIERLAPLCEHPTFGYLYRTLTALCRVLVRKADFGVRLRAAYRAGDKGLLAALAAECDAIVADLDDFLAVFRAQWMCESRPQGFATQELRIGGLRARMLSAKERILALLSGACESLPELEEEPLPYMPIGEDTPYGNFNVWSRQVTACIL